MGIDIFSLFGETSANVLIPGRDPGSISGSLFIDKNMNLNGSVREQNILNEFLGGNIPDFLRKFVPITINYLNDTITYLTMPDYLSIGSNDDFIRMPMNPHTAQTIADKYDCTLPTKKMVHDIWSKADFKINPHPHGPPYDASMESSERYLWHENTIKQQFKDLNISIGSFISGIKKDVVITNKLTPNNPNKRVAIYGWIQPDGIAIQGLNPSSHEDTYADYSHGIRLIANDVIVNGKVDRIQNVFKDIKLSLLISDEGPLNFLAY